MIRRVFANDFSGPRQRFWVNLFPDRLLNSRSLVRESRTLDTGGRTARIVWLPWRQQIIQIPRAAVSIACEPPVMNEENPPPRNPRATAARWPWWLATVCVGILLVAIFLPRPEAPPPESPASLHRSGTKIGGSGAGAWSSRAQEQRGTSEIPPTAEEIVARKLSQFGQSRRDLVHALAKHLKVEVPAGVERFFTAVAGGRWEEIDAAHSALLVPGQGFNPPRSPELQQIWRAVKETWGIAREAHNWPAQKLLDYGEAVLGSLRPGMIYVGGTDAGCFIPTFLNETSEGERHVTLTQNALADGTYLEYLRFLYGDRLTTLTGDDSQRAFQDYIADAQKRLQHDQQFPDEPKQLLPGENIQVTEGRVQVSGQVPVMAINEKLLQILMDKNPGATFAIEQSFAFKSLYADTTPLGPIMELRSRDEQNALTAERATQSLDYWRTTLQQLAADPDTPPDSDPRNAYAKLAAEQAALLLDRQYATQAEQIYRLASELSPTMPEAVLGYVELLKGQNRLDEALLVAENAVKAAPTNKAFSALVEKLKAAKK